MTKIIYRITLPLWAALLCTSVLVAASADGHLSFVRATVALF